MDQNIRSKLRAVVLECRSLLEQSIKRNCRAVLAFMLLVRMAISLLKTRPAWDTSTEKNKSYERLSSITSSFSGRKGKLPLTPSISL